MKHARSLLSAVVIGISMVIMTYFSAPTWVLIVIPVILTALFGLIPFNQSSSESNTKQEVKNHSLSESHQNSLQQLSDSASMIAIDAAGLSHFMDSLASSMEIQVNHASEIASKVTSLEETNSAISSSIAETKEKVKVATEDTQRSNELLASVNEHREGLNRHISSTSELLVELKDKAESISSITDTINQLADQTNLLALNAAIEAARAGEHGRGFAVVADEVRNLAHKTTDATNEIEGVLGQISSNSIASVEAINNLAEVGHEMTSMLSEVFELSGNASNNSQLANESINLMYESVAGNIETNKGISAHTNSLYLSINEIDSDLKLSSERITKLTHKTEGIFLNLYPFELDNRNNYIQHIAVETAKKIGQTFEASILSGRISENDLFDTNYQPIANTNPQKFSTKFDKFTDEVLPAIQEAVLAENGFVIYAGAVDKNGYFPTHNKKFSQPLTGNYDTDMVNNRTKRMFNDYTGARCGSNQLPFLFQTYKRDTGEVMHDLSSPIYVNGKHWGGFRIGFQPEETSH